MASDQEEDLLRAAKHGDAGAISAALQGSDRAAFFAARDHDDRSVLHLAVLSGSARATRIVMGTEEGRDLGGTKDKTGWTPLHHAIHQAG